MAPKTLPPRELLRELLDYDPATGILTWLPRPREMFTQKDTFLRWNKCFAGTVAGNERPRGISVGMLGTLYSAHRLIWLLVNGEPVPAEIDHIDGNPCNNLITNLRAATRSQNVANTRRRVDNISGIKGVRHSGSGGRVGFVARIKVDGETTYLGSFATLQEAARARREAAIRLHGEFARFDD